MAFANPAAFGIGGVPRVNLMPRAETERRERGALLRRWIWALVGALFIVVLATAGAFWMQFTAQQRLAEANTQTTNLLTDLAGLSDVRVALDAETQLETFRADAMGADLGWAAMQTALVSTLPDGVTLTGFTIAPGAIPTGDDPTLEVGATGSLTLSSETPVDIVPLIRAMRPLAGVIEADGWQLTTGDGGFTYEIRMVLDQTFYAGQYAEEPTE